MQNYKIDLLNYLEKKRFVICVLLTALIAYGFSTVNLTYSVDDLNPDYYLGRGQAMLGAGRFTMTLLGTIMRYSHNKIFNSFAIDFMAVFMLMWAAVNFCILFRRICAEVFTLNTATFFSCFLVSYPLIMEIWEYTGTNLVVTFGFVKISFALLMVHHALHNAGSYRCIIGAVLLLMFVCAGYESVVIVYVFGVFAVLFLQTVFGSAEEKKLRGIIVQGLCYAGVLAMGLVLKVIIHRLILVVGNISPAQIGERSIEWLNRPPKEALMTMLAGNFERIILKGIIFFPITELVAACVLLLVAAVFLCRKHSKAMLLPMFGMYFCLIMLSAIQGSIPIYRTCQVYGFFTAFVAALVFMALERCKLTKIKLICMFLCGYLCFQQAIYLNYFLTLNHQRSESELNVVKEIGHDLQRGFDLSKPVVFVGNMWHSNEITEAASIPEDSVRWQLYKKLFLACEPISPARFNENQLNRKLTESNIIYLISYSIYVPSPTPMRELFSFQGYDIQPGPIDVYYDIAHDYVYANGIPAYPNDGYICDTGDYIVVHVE